MAGILYFDGIDVSSCGTLGSCFETQTTVRNAGEIKAKTLDWVNQMRRSLGGGPINGLPQGAPQNKRECVIAKCFGDFGIVSVEPMCMSITTNDSKMSRTTGMYLPDVVMKFISLFDAGRLPELILGFEEKADEPKPTKEDRDISDAKKFMETLWVSPDNGKIFIYPPLPTNKAETELISAAYS